MDLSKLREIRRKKGISLEDMEKRFGMSRELIGKFEKGKASPRLCFLLEWCEYLDVKIGFIDDNTVRYPSIEESARYSKLNEDGTINFHPPYS